MKILLQPCSKGIPLKHFEDTIAHGVPMSLLETRLNHDEYAKLKSLNADEVRAWGFVANKNIKIWNTLEEGDTILFYGEKKFFFIGTIFSKAHNELLAEELWGRDEKDKTWEYMFFLKEGKDIQIPYDPTILVGKNGEKYLPTQVVQGAALLTSENTKAMKNYIEKVEGTVIDESSIEPTVKEEGDFRKSHRNPKNIKELEKEIERISAEIADRPAKEKIKVAKILERNRTFSRLVKERADYICEICGSPPFKQKNGFLYAEAHHKFELAKTRIDNPRDMICVCASCHRVIHYGTDNELKKRYELKSKKGATSSS